jgi:hypothetical protein
MNKDPLTNLELATLKDLVTRCGAHLIRDRVDTISNELYAEGATLRQVTYKKNKASYQKTKDRKEARGERYKTLVLPGDVIEVEGASGKWREVLKVTGWQVECRKLKWNNGGKFFVRDSYFTSHMFNKIKRIVKEYDVKD